MSSGGRDPNRDKPWFDPFAWGSGLRGLTKTTDLSRRTQTQLGRVYGNLTITSVFAVLANYLYSQGILFEPGIFIFLLSALCLFGISLVPATPENTVSRHGLLYGFGFMNGWGVAPLVFSLFTSSPETLMTALISTTILFGSFTATSLYASRRSLLYLGGLLGATTLIILLLSLANIWFRSQSLLSAELYLGLFMFCGYIMYDTQLMIERFEAGLSDTVQPAAELFTNLAGIFIRLLLILSRDRNTRRREDQRRKPRDEQY